MFGLEVGEGGMIYQWQYTTTGRRKFRLIGYGGPALFDGMRTEWVIC